MNSWLSVFSVDLIKFKTSTDQIKNILLLIWLPTRINQCLVQTEYSWCLKGKQKLDTYRQSGTGVCIHKMWHTSLVRLSAMKTLFLPRDSIPRGKKHFVWGERLLDMKIRTAPPERVVYLLKSSQWKPQQHHQFW